MSANDINELDATLGAFIYEISNTNRFTVKSVI